MKRYCKKFIFLIAGLVLMAAAYSINASANGDIVCDKDVDVIVQDFAKAYSDSLVQQNTDKLQQIMIDNDDNTFFEAFMEWRFAIMENMNSGYRSHNCDITNIEIVTVKEDIISLVSI